MRRYTNKFMVLGAKPYIFAYYDGAGWINRVFINASEGFGWLDDRLPDLTLEETLQLIKYKNDIIR